MAFEIKKYIHHADLVSSCIVYEREFPALIQLTTLVSDYKKLGEDGWPIGTEQQGSIISNGMFHQIIEIGPHGAYYLNLRDDYCLREIETYPAETVIDIGIVNNLSSRLFYAFYNPNNEGVLTIKARAVKDGGETYRKIKSSPNDPIWIDSFIIRSRKQVVLPVKENKEELPEIMNASEVAKYLGLEEKTIRNWTSSKKIPVIKLGGTVRYRKTDIDKFLEQNTVAAKVKIKR